MRAARYHIFKKNGWLLALFLLLFCMAKYQSVRMNRELHDLSLPTLQGWLEECAELDTAGRKEFIEELTETVYAREEEEIRKSYTKLYAYHMRVKEVEALIRFAQVGEGELPKNLPANYLKLQDFYSGLSRPMLINETPLEIYWSLQRRSIVFVLTVFLCAVFFGQYYETGIHQYAAVTAEGRTYRRTFRRILLALCLFFLVCNEIFDFLYSGIMTDPLIWKASLQSYERFSDAQADMSIGTCLSLLWVSKVAGTVILYQLACFLAEWKKSMKDTLIVCIFLLFFFVFIGGSFRPFLQVGCTDWESLVSGTRRLPGWPLSFLSVGVILTLLWEGVMLLLIRFRNKRTGMQ